MNVPKVFISYSHDSEVHKEFVLKLATELRGYGVDAKIDTWDVSPGDDLPEFMEKSLTEADFVIAVCTKKYVEKSNEGKGGVGYEKMIITSSMLDDHNTKKVIPIIRQSVKENALPTFLKSKLYIDFSEDDRYEASFDELARKILESPKFPIPPIGKNPYESDENRNVSFEKLLREIFDEEIANNLISKKNSKVAVMLNPITVTELDHYSELGLVEIRSTGSMMSMGAGNRIGNNVEERKRPYGMGSSFILNVMPNSL